MCVLLEQMQPAVKQRLTWPFVVLMALSAWPLVIKVAKPKPFKAPEISKQSVYDASVAQAQCLYTSLSVDHRDSSRNTRTLCKSPSGFVGKDSSQTKLPPDSRAAFSSAGFTCSSKDLLLMQQRRCRLYHCKLPQHGTTADTATNLKGEITNDETPLLEMQAFTRNLTCPQSLLRCIITILVHLLTLSRLLGLLRQRLTMQNGCSCQGCLDAVIHYKDNLPCTSICLESGVTDVKV